jgi:hypothetical protein
VLVLVQQQQLIVAMHQLVLVPLLELMPFVLELIIIQLQLLQHRLMDQLQRFEQRLQQQVLHLQLPMQVPIQLRLQVKQFFLLQFRQQLSLQVQRLQELRHQFRHQLIDIQLQLRIMKFMLNSKLEIIA